jgi:CubicO group peptidase (beta-lactamase class C family)
MSYKLRIRCLKFSSIAVLLLILQSAPAQVSRKNPKEIGIDRFAGLDATVQRHQKLLGNHLVVMVWTDTLVYKREIGEFDARTIAPIGAAGNWLTTALVLKLVEEGKLSLDDKVSDYLPIFETYGKAYITLRHCLTHFTGIQSEGGSGLLGKKKFASLEEEVNAFAKKEIKTNPGTEFSYSNIGLNIAGRVLEVVTKKKFDMLIKQKLFNPLAMRRSTFGTLDGSAINPSGGAQSSAEEYMRFLKMLLNKGVYNGQQILSESSIAELRKISTSPELIRYSPKSAEGFSYAMGSYVLDESKNGEATALASPGLYGAWPMVDWCRGYASLVLVKSLLDEQKKDVYLQMKDAVDEELRNKCQ